jgi:hypothetical protein
MIAAVTFTDADIETWRTDGWVLVEGVLDADELAAAAVDVDRKYPSWDEVHEGTATQPYFTHFPYHQPALDSLALHPTLIDFAERALGGPVLFSHSEMLSKYAGHGDYDQELHQDYGNNSLIVPSLTDPDQVASITYLTDSTVDLGPTGVVGYCDAGPWQDHLRVPRSEAPELYEREQLALAPAGSTLFYTQRTLHRGTAMHAERGTRHTLHVAFQKAGSTWAGWRSLAMGGNDPALATLLCALSPRQRTILGFPAPGHPYWTSETLTDVGRRYPAMDLGPYRAAVA